MDNLRNNSMIVQYASRVVNFNILSSYEEGKILMLSKSGTLH